MEPALPSDSLNLFRAGVNGSHAGRILCVGRFTDSGPLESRSVGILAVMNAEAEWAEQGLRLDFLSRGAQSTLLNEARHRVISEWVTVLDRATYRPVRTGGFNPPAETAAPRLNEWLSMTKERSVRSAAGFATPPEVFEKYPELVTQNPILSQMLMTNFWAFRRWINLQPRMLERLTIVGRAANVPGGSRLSQMIATAWVTRGEAFQQWYERVIEPLCRS